MLTDKAIEEYQILLTRNPSAKVFAPLAEAYRKMGLLKEAMDICEKGTRYNPDYPSGFVAFGRVLFELKRFEDALEQFEQASLLQADSLLARKLKALCLTKLQKPEQAVAAYKEVLLLSPNDTQAIKYLQTWEYQEAQSMPADYWPDHEELTEHIVTSTSTESASAYVEALIAQNELSQAKQVLSLAISKWPEDALLKKQRTVVAEFLDEQSQQQLIEQQQTISIRIHFLQKMLRKLNYEPATP